VSLSELKDRRIRVNVLTPDQVSRQDRSRCSTTRRRRVGLLRRRVVELGAESLHAPQLWPEYHPGYFGAFVRDPDGNNVEAVCHA
jgi:catechol 2,3-dioxygenase-like lactoylglutathione lyase family enzyme